MHTHRHACAHSGTRRIALLSTLLTSPPPVTLAWPLLSSKLEAAWGPFPLCYLNGSFSTSSWSLLKCHLLFPSVPLFFNHFFSALFFIAFTTFSLLLPALLAFLILSIAYCLPLMQESKVHKGRIFFCSLTWPKCLKWCTTHSRYAINSYGLNRWFLKSRSILFFTQFHCFY